MTPRTTQRMPRLRTCGFLLLALLLVVQPLALLAGELHELAHNPQSSPLGLADLDGNTEACSPQQSTSDCGGALHMFVHCGHCCGAFAAIPHWVHLPLAHAGNQAPRQARAGLTTVPLPAPFKPPIAA